ncbi:MAG: 30S ribosomal protein S5 [Aeriscardovia sp.]|nr:30S ribosomal protein S5 [Aeriscardovia sp.]
MTEEVKDEAEGLSASPSAPEEEAQDHRDANRRRRRRSAHRERSEVKDELMSRVVSINRVSKTHKGGRTMSFAALVVVGDGKGAVGAGTGKSREVPAAIAKAESEAKKNMISVCRLRGSIPEPVMGHDSAGKVLLKPAAPGTGVIAGGSVRAVLECAGISDILTKSMGSSNPINTVRATINALEQLEEPIEIANRRGLTLREVAPASILHALQEEKDAAKKENSEYGGGEAE